MTDGPLLKLSPDLEDDVSLVRDALLSALEQRDWQLVEKVIPFVEHLDFAIGRAALKARAPVPGAAQVKVVS